jgi:RimJ/RimL family protein N-acetyltransferase
VKLQSPTINGMTSEYWPLTGLRIRSGQLELRLPDAADLEALAVLAERGVHDPAEQPFSVPWTDTEPAARALGTMQHHWSCWGSWKSASWDLNLVAVQDGVVAGTQGIGARNFAIMREVGTGSWLGLRYQRQGIGTRMRAAVLALAFDGLGAEFATSGAFLHNEASLAISRKLGYRADGMERYLIRGKPADMQRLRLDRASWAAHRTIDVAIAGLDACLPSFGLG